MIVCFVWHVLQFASLFSLSRNISKPWRHGGCFLSSHVESNSWSFSQALFIVFWSVMITFKNIPLWIWFWISGGIILAWTSSSFKLAPSLWDTTNLISSGDSRKARLDHGSHWHLCDSEIRRARQNSKVPFLWWSVLSCWAAVFYLQWREIIISCLLIFSSQWSC